MAKTKNDSYVIAQGDIILERVGPAQKSIAKDKLVTPDADGSTVLARGEVHGHRHRFTGDSGVVMFRDDALASSTNIPTDLYGGHVSLDAPADLVHEEHDTIAVPEGTYIVRRQRELSGEEERRVMD